MYFASAGWHSRTDYWGRSLTVSPLWALLITSDSSKDNTDKLRDTAASKTENKKKTGILGNWKLAARIASSWKVSPPLWQVRNNTNKGKSSSSRCHLLWSTSAVSTVRGQCLRLGHFQIGSVKFFDQLQESFYRLYWFPTALIFEIAHLFYQVEDLCRWPCPSTTYLLLTLNDGFQLIF